MGFVDDTRKFNNQNTIATSLEENVIMDVKKWQTVSNIVAGKLNLEKCGSYIITWKYDKKGKLVMDDTTEYNLEIPDINGAIKRIKSLKSSEAYKYLGVTTAPNENRNDTRKVIQKICHTFKVALYKARITHEEAYLALHIFFLPKITYQLPCYYMSENEMTNMQKIYEPMVISKMGYNCKWERSLRYGTHGIGSIQIPNLYLEQTIQQVMFLMKALNNKDMANLMDNVLDTYQFQLGIGNDMFQED